ncbi:HNH endonuclease [Desulfonema magnum]|nr:HNH endonuclease signature motif containing protein [Desulfonema magnum]
MGTYISASLRRMVYERAGGCCEYCLIPETTVLAAHEIDHIIAQKHGGLTEADNLALSCAICNKHKGSDLASLDPVTGEIVALYHPRRERWSDHFELKEGRLIPLTPTGRVTIKLLQLNNPYRIQERSLLIRSGIFPNLKRH